MDVFVHIPKSGGSTLRTIISREYGVRRVLYYEAKADGTPPIEGDELLEVIARRDIRLITGHMQYGVHAKIKQPCRYFSMVRDPIKRALSDYYYAFSYANHRHRDEIVSGKLTVERFLSSPRYAPSVSQAIQLATGRQSPRRSVAGAAIDNLTSGILVVGTAERFLESLLLMAKALGWRPPLFASRNVTRLDAATQAARAAAEAEARERFSSHFFPDYRVYRAVDALLSQRIAAEGAAFQRALAALREMQADIAERTRDGVFGHDELAVDEPLPPAAVRHIDSAPYRVVADYLESGPPAWQRTSNYIGNVDRFGGGAIAGWATDLARDEPIEVTVRVRGRRAGAALCDRYREDLVRAGYPRGAMGFRFASDVEIAGRDDFSVYFEDTGIELTG